MYFTNKIIKLFNFRRIILFHIPRNAVANLYVRWAESEEPDPSIHPSISIFVKNC